MTPIPKLPDDEFYETLLEAAYALDLFRPKRKRAKVAADDNHFNVRGDALRNVVEPIIKMEYSINLREHNDVPYTFSFCVEKEKNTNITIYVKLEDKNQNSGNGAILYNIAQIHRSDTDAFSVELFD